MLAVEKKKKYTVDDYMMLEEGAPFQLIGNDLIMSPSPTPLHQLLSLRLSNFIFNFLEHKDDGGFLVNAPIDVKFDDGNVLQPDIIYISAERRSELIKDRIEGAPDLVIEILSPSNAYYDLRQKKDIYEKFGVKEYIIIDPVQENADVYVLKGNGYQLPQKIQKHEVLNPVVLPGLSIPLAKLFK